MQLDEFLQTLDRYRQSDATTAHTIKKDFEALIRKAVAKSRPNIAHAKFQLEQDLHKMLISRFDEFEEQTGICVSGVDVSFVQNAVLGPVRDRRYILRDVRVTLGI